MTSHSPYSTPDSTDRHGVLPRLEPEAGWVPLKPRKHVGMSGQFIHDGENRLRVQYYCRAADRALVGKAWFGPGTEGAPGVVHGGAITAVLDELLGQSGWLAGYRVVTATLTTDFRKRIPTGTETVIEGWVSRVEGRKVHTAGRILDASGEPYAEGRGVFVDMPREAFGEMADDFPQPVDSVQGE